MSHLEYVKDLIEEYEKSLNNNINPPEAISNDDFLIDNDSQAQIVSATQSTFHLKKKQTKKRILLTQTKGEFGQGQEWKTIYLKKQMKNWFQNRSLGRRNMTSKWNTMETRNLKSRTLQWMPQQDRNQWKYPFYPWKFRIQMSRYLEWGLTKTNNFSFMYAMTKSNTGFPISLLSKTIPCL